MDILRIPLIILFKNQNPFRILGEYYYNNVSKKMCHELIDSQMFVDLCQQEENHFSKDEAQNINYIVNQCMKKNSKGIGLNNSVFNLLLNYAEEKLDNCGEVVRCRYKELLKWREITLKLDQDLFICPFFAAEDLLMNKNRKYFDWDVIIKSNNIRLHNLLSEGMSENHFHLKGSAPCFKLNWVSFMNDLDCSKDMDFENDERLDKDEDGDIVIREAIQIAAIIRVILFEELIGINNSQLENKLNEIIIPYEGKRNKYKVNSDTLTLYYDYIKKEISSLKYLCGTDLRYKSRNTKVDYAIISEVSVEDRTSRLFSGERNFMYSCFKKIYENDKKFIEKADLFYAYLILKNKVRAELVQENRRVGFSNFSDYQNRKSKYIRKNTLLSDSLEALAVLTSVQNQNIISLEARIVPDNKIYKNISYIKEMDLRICNEIFNDKRNYWIRNYDRKIREISSKNDLSISEKKIIYSKDEYDRYEEIINDIKNKYFFVYHFPKKKDIPISINDINSTVRCRHYKYRKELKDICSKLKNMREKNPEYADRILGIDACSNELVARPEIYGQAFRFLKGHLPSYDYRREIMEGKSLQRLRATYHVGEDFLDIIDGLRAIDEAIGFLELTHGDRLGHAIVLGIDVKKWYKNKFNRVYLTKQNILDNVAWIINKIKQFNLNTGYEIIDKLNKYFNKYYVEIYMDGDYRKNEFISTESVIPVDTYISAWKLRGDDPEVYLRNNKEKFTYWDRCAVRKENNSGLVRELYMRYHYDPNVKAKGDVIEPFKIEPYIIDVAIKIQKEMQIYVRERGIGIETNPSSNLSISTFNRYDEHPIFNFYNKGLNYEDKFDNPIPQMFVSINTDDQGVFDTLLENEFALMAIALEKVKDKDGKPKYNQSEVYDWIDRVRKMGNQQSFRTVINEGH